MNGLSNAGADRRIRSRSLWLPVLAAVALAAAGFAVAALAGVGPLAELGGAPRTIVVVAKNMAFFVDGAAEHNPRIAVGRGERVRFVLRNEDPGMAHDLSLPTLGRSTRALRQAGTSAEVTLRMPETPGELDYLCTFHAQTMRGVLEIR